MWHNRSIFYVVNLLLMQVVVEQYNQFIFCLMVIDPTNSLPPARDLTTVTNFRLNEHCNAKCTLWDQSCVVGLIPLFLLGGSIVCRPLYCKRCTYILWKTMIFPKWKKRTIKLIYLLESRNSYIFNEHPKSETAKKWSCGRMEVKSWSRFW